MRKNAGGTPFENSGQAGATICMFAVVNWGGEWMSGTVGESIARVGNRGQDVRATSGNLTERRLRPQIGDFHL